MITGLETAWSPETLDAWLAGLSTESPTKSIRHLGVGSAKDRSAIVAYIASLPRE
jgi:cytochrome c2